ncbi:MAG: translocation/assembly module TamB domain-containing protein [Flavobacteriales bacterium]|nr:translocation/assembly module TamB domain-containing protein [Flavobacteriales bacterium]
MKKALSKVLKFIVYGFAILFVLLVATIAIFSFSGPQTWLARQFTERLSADVGAEVKIDKVSVNFSGDLVFHHALVRDQENDTLFYIQKLSGKLWSLNQEQHYVELRSMSIEKPLVNFKVPVGDGPPNYWFFISHFQVPSDGEPVIWHINFRNLKMKDGEFRYKINGAEPVTDRDFDEGDFAFRQINGEFKDFRIIGDSLDFKVKNLSTTEKNGLHVKRMVCKAKIHYNGMEYSDLLLETDHSRLEDYLSFSYAGYGMLSDFIDKVSMKADLQQSLVSVKDLAYFSHNLTPYEMNNVIISGNAKGTVRRFKVRNAHLTLGSESVIKGKFDFKGLPDWQSAFADIELSELRTCPEDVLSIFNLSELPPRLDRFEDIVFSGHLTGFYTDFAADGVMNSALGLLRSRINFKLKDEIPFYTGQLIAEDFDAGSFLGNPQLGRTSFNFDLDEGRGLNFEDLSAKFRSSIQYIEFNGYPIRSLVANGIYKNESFDGIAKANDDDVRFTFDGKMDFNPKIPTYLFTADVDHLNLKRLNLDSSESSVSGLMAVNLRGSNLDNLDGVALLSDVEVKRGDFNVDLEKLELRSSIDQQGRHLDLKSDILDASIDGHFNFSYLDLVYDDILQTLFPDYYTQEIKLPQNVTIQTRMVVRENELIGNLMQQNLFLGNGHFSADYNSVEESLEIDGTMDRLVWDQYRLDQYYLNVRKKPHQLLNLSTDVSQFFVNDTLLTRNILLNASILPNDVDYLFNFGDTSDQIALRSYGALHFVNDTIGLRIMSSNLYTEGSAWQINDNNHMWFTRHGSFLDSLTLYRANQQVRFSGEISEQSTKPLNIDLKRFQLENLNPILKAYDVQTGGVAEGGIQIFHLLERPVIHANLDIDQLAYNGDTLGKFSISTVSNEDPLFMRIRAEVKEGILKDISCMGDIDLRKDPPRFDLDIRASKASVVPLQAIFNGVASDFSGTMTANARLKGNKDLYTLKGVISLEQARFKVDYLNTVYSVNDRIYLNDKSIEFKSLKVQDERGSTAKVNGAIRHNLFSDFELDLSINDVKDFMCLNTTKEDNSVFYGTGIASGNISFTGPLDNLLVDIKATSSKGTRLVIPLYTESDNQLVEYIRFKQPVDTTKIKAKTRLNSNSGLTVKMDFNVTEDAEFNLVFDEVLDDRITGFGTGNIQMEYTSFEDFYMFGDFRVKRGIYPFSSPTLVSEKFDLREGGRIVWNGDPYNAYIDLQASVARNRANPKDLMLGYVTAADAENYNTNIKMNVILFLKGELFSPDITFGMEFPDNSSISGLTQFNSLIKRVEEDPDELNRQIFSLLTFGSFVPASGNNADPNNYRDIVSSSVGSFLSNQVNNWISEYDQNWEFGVDYTTRSGITDEEKAELIVSARRKLFNERLELAGSYNAYSTGSINPYNVDLIYNVKKDGSLKLKAYHKLANDPTLGQVSNVTTTGVGFYFKKQFNRIKWWGRKED